MASAMWTEHPLGLSRSCANLLLQLGAPVVLLLTRTKKDTLEVPYHDTIIHVIARMFLKEIKARAIQVHLSEPQGMGVKDETPNLKSTLHKPRLPIMLQGYTWWTLFANFQSHRAK